MQRGDGQGFVVLYTPMDQATDYVTGVRDVRQGQALADLTGVQLVGKINGGS